MMYQASDRMKLPLSNLMADLPQGFKRTHASTEFHEIHFLSSSWLIFLVIACCLSIYQPWTTA